MRHQDWPRRHAYRLEGLVGEALERELQRTVPERLHDRVRYLVLDYLPVQARHAEMARQARARRTPLDVLAAMRGRR